MTDDAGTGDDDDAGLPVDCRSLDRMDLEAPLERDTIFETLTNRRRRMLLQFLDAMGGEGHLNDAARCIAAAEEELPPRKITDADKQRVYVSLYQHHLPYLESIGVIDFESGLVRIRQNASVLYPYLDLDPSTYEPPSESGFLSKFRTMFE